MPLVDTKVEVHYYDGGVTMEKVPKGTYTKEFKEEAARMVTEQGLSISEVGRRLSIPKSTIANWVRSAEKGILAKGKKSVTREEMVVARLKREIAELRMERDILKKATEEGWLYGAAHKDLFSGELVGLAWDHESPRTSLSGLF